jgi:acyl carrier protein
MNTQEIINLIEDALEIEQNSLSESTNLSEIPEYDSMAKLSLIILSDDEFGKKLSGEQIREFKIVGDIVKFLSAD